MLPPSCDDPLTWGLDTPLDMMGMGMAHHAHMNGMKPLSPMSTSNGHLVVHDVTPLEVIILSINRTIYIFLSLLFQFLISLTLFILLMDILIYLNKSYYIIITCI